MATSLRARPLTVASKRIGISFESQSCTSCGVNWKCHLIRPSTGFSASSEQVYRLSPGRTSPFQSGPGLPVPQYTRLSAGSYEPVSQEDPPPFFQLSPPHVSEPGSPGRSKSTRLNSSHQINSY